ncbi:outer membrane protein assembly factor BamE [Pandoraea apista]|uniref:Outer membrane protein assembly factor BamE n=2 Tax=Pandoraea apista TaxID=93218 RepID=A0ABX9ZM44_9BURK|nr:outer membrane protein assembly factor BamE [Pandoraea apista]RRJ30053.1 outer membrane protein assembly factor BamE [Pandoraea apista]RRJ80199.1 outer membrane protein assembly factor BamE [Pandoraea apista]RSD12893.1 outer membrane protein assembly factor BamE [Pandoraea apista]RSD18368.1 outer membrane protein assembly factor BamE [Pandoraea apista]
MWRRARRAGVMFDFFESESDLRRYLSLPFSVCAAAAFLVLAGCSTYDSVTDKVIGVVTPYRINIVQGNFVSKEAYDQLKPGMTRDQVRQLLGTPLLTDIFHADRWDYVFYFKRGNASVVQERHLKVYFSGDTLARWEGGENLPTEYQLVQEIDGQKGKTVKTEAPAPSTASAAAAEAAAPSPNAAAVAPTAAPAATDVATTVPAAPATQASPAADSSASGSTGASGGTGLVPSPRVTSGGLFSTPK